MRIGAFELDFTFMSILSVAEVYSGKAPLLRSLRIRNVRGGETDWLKIQAFISGFRTKQKAVRHLPVHDESEAVRLENELLSDLLLPASLQPGKHEGEFRISFPDGEKAIPFSLTILSSSWMPADLAHAPYLASWIRTEDDELREFAAGAVKETDNRKPIQCIQALYETLTRQSLMYQPPASTLYPDFQPISDLHYILHKGGSCADLSLLMVSLLWIRGLSPALLVYCDHMTAGCFAGTGLPDFETLENPKLIADMILSHQLIMPEITGVCSHQQIPFADSLTLALTKIQQNKSGCCLVNLKTILRHGTVQPLPDAFHEKTVCCPRCGFDHIALGETENEICCPACGLTFTLNSGTVPIPAFIPEITYDPGSVRYECKSQKAGAVKCLPGAAEAVKIIPRWENKPVTYIAAHAFENSMICGIILPESITEIGDRAFRGCEKLAALQLPPDLSRLGSGAFSSCGLQSIRIPGSVTKIPLLCFSGCSQLETVILEEGFREIDPQAFIHCPKLKSVYLPSSVQKVSKTAFDACCQLIFASSRTRIN